MGVYDGELHKPPFLIDMNHDDIQQRERRGGASPTTEHIMMNGKDENNIITITPSSSSTAPQPVTVASKRGRKTDREREETGGRREWADSEISQLMQLWRENEILYDTNHPLYYVQSERKLVMDQISQEMNISVRDVNDKMHSLRTYYCSQRQRTEAMEKSGNGRSLPRWKFYDQMSFLYESVTNRAAKSSLNATKRGRKSQHRISEPQGLLEQQQTSPYSMAITSRDSYSPSSRENELRQHYHDRGIPYPEERYEIHNGIHRRPTPITYQQSTSPASSEEIPRKRHLSDHGYPWSEMLPYKDSCSTTSKDGMTYRTIEIQLNSSDEIFGHMVACSLSQMSDDQEKELLKLEIQKLVYNTRFKCNGNR